MGRNFSISGSIAIAVAEASDPEDETASYMVKEAFCRSLTACTLGLRFVSVARGKFRGVVIELTAHLFCGA